VGYWRRIILRNGVDPGGECGAEAAGEYLAEVPDMPGGGVHFRTAGQNLRGEADSSLTGEISFCSGSPRASAKRLGVIRRLL
jgi:hypothetical protein